MSSKPQLTMGTYVGTGAAINVEIGFQPDYLRIWNETDNDAAWEWHNGLGAGEVLNGTGATHTASNGVTLYAGTRGGDSEGFSVGTALSESGKTFRYLAMRGADA